MIKNTDEALKDYLGISDLFTDKNNVTRELLNEIVSYASYNWSNYKSIALVKPNSKLSNTELELLNNLPDILDLGFYSKVLLFSPKINLNKNNHKALIKLLYRGLLSVYKVYINNNDTYLLKKRG